MIRGYENALCGMPIEEMPVDTNLIWRHTYETFTRSHLFTNEDLDAHMDAVDYADKQVLGILGSGDHMFSSIFRGCEGYTGVDMSIYSLLFSELKLASMKNLGYQEFIDFLTYDDSRWADPEHIELKDGFVGDCFSRNHFERVKSDLSSTAKRFFEHIIGKYYIVKDYSATNHNKQTPYICRFIQGPAMKDVSHIPYLKTEENYEKAKTRLDDVSPKLILSDIRDSISTLDGPFDIMHLTNIITYTNTEYMARLFDESKSILNPGSKIVFYIGVFEGRTGSGINYNKKRSDLEELGYKQQRFEGSTDYPNALLKNAFVIDL